MALASASDDGHMRQRTLIIDVCVAVQLRCGNVGTLGRVKHPWT